MTNEICYPIHEGKVRKSYELYSRVVETTNRLSVFDRVVVSNVNSKGAVLNFISNEFKHLTADIAPNDLIDVPETFFQMLGFGEEYTGRMSLVKPLSMIPIEFIVRGYLTGSGWTSYKQTGKICGVYLPNGMKESEKLAMPIVTPTTKADTSHDQAVTREETVDIVTFWLLEMCDYSESSDPDEAAHQDAENIVKTCYDYALSLYEYISKYAEKRGIIFVDTKFEFGLDDDGYVVLGDEVGTPDSSRFSPADKYQVGRKFFSMDKQVIRNFCADAGFHGDENEDIPDIPDSVIKKVEDTYIDIANRLFGDNSFILHLISCSEERKNFMK